MTETDRNGQQETETDSKGKNGQKQKELTETDKNRYVSVDKNNSDRLARAIYLKPQDLSYPNSWLVVMEALCEFVCLCGSWRFLLVLDVF